MNILITFHTREAARAAFLATKTVEAVKYDTQSRIKLNRGGWIVFRSCGTMIEAHELAGLAFQAVIPGDGELPLEIQRWLLSRVRESS